MRNRKRKKLSYTVVKKKMRVENATSNFKQIETLK